MNQISIDRTLLRWILLGLGFIGIIVMVVAAILSAPNYLGNPWVIVGIVVGALGAALFILLDPQALVKTATGRSGQYALVSVLVTASLIFVVGVLYWVVDQQLKPSPLAKFGEISKYQLSDKTINLLKDLKEDVHATGYFTNQQTDMKDQADLWLREYKRYSNGKLTYEFVNPDLNPLLAPDIHSNTIVFTKGDQKGEASVLDEQNLTNALVRVLTGKPRKGYLITGHGELSVESVSGDSLSQISKSLGNANVTLEPLNLLDTKTVPDDADLIIIARPTSQFGPGEVDAIKAYLDKGKAAMFMFDVGANSAAVNVGVLSADINVDGSLVVTGNADGTAGLWDSTGKEIATLRGHTGVVNEVVFSPDGKQVATASIDNTVRVWDVATAKQTALLEGTIDNVQRLAFSPDGKLLASVGIDQNVNVWDASTYKPMSYSPIKLTVPLLAIAFSPDSATLAVGGGGDASGIAGAKTTVFLREAATGKEVFTKTLPTNSVVSMVFSTDGKTLYNATVDGALGTMDVATGDITSQTFYSADPGVAGFTVLGDGSFAFALRDGAIHIHPADATSADKDTVLSEHTKRIWTIRASSDGKSFVSASQDGTTRVWKVGQAASSLKLAEQAASDKLLSYLTSDWGITVNDDVVIDRRADQLNGSPFKLETFVQSQMSSSSPITQPLIQPLHPVYFEIAHSVAAAEKPPDGVSLTKLVTTTEGPGNSWGETSPVTDGAVAYDPATDIAGPVALAVSGENAKTHARVVVLGDSDFTTDTILSTRTTYGNANLVINAVNWLSAKEELIDLPTNDVGTRTISQPLLPAETILLLITSLCCIPGGLMVAGGVIFFVRRQRR